MTRTVLALGLSALALVLGLITALLQSQNYKRGLDLNQLKESCSMLEATAGDQAALILERDSAPLKAELDPITHKPIAPNAPVKPPVKALAPAAATQAIAHASPARRHAEVAP